MNIGIVTTWFERGASYVSLQYIKTLSQEHTVFVYARGGEKFGEGAEWNGQQVTFGDLKWGKDFSKESRQKNIAHFEQWLKEKEIELVVFNEEHWWEPIILCSTLNIKTLAYVDYYTKQTVPFFNIYDVLICHTKRHLSVFKDHPQAVYVPWGTDTDIFVPKRLNTNKVVFFHSAGMNPYRKGTDLVISAFALLPKESAKLIIHSQKDIECSVEGVEIIKDTVGPPGLYHMGNVYVYPSRLEGIGLTLAEALSCGLPVITSDNAPMNEFVQNERGSLVGVKSFKERHDGYYWPEGYVDVTDLAHAMRSYIDDPYSKSAAARRYAEQYLSWNKNSQAILDIIKQAKSISGKEKIYPAIYSYEKIKTSKLRRLIYKTRLLKFGIFSYCFNYLKNKI